MEKQLPFNLDAEQALLGSILIDPEAITRVADTLQTKHFYRDSHQTIYEVVFRLYSHQQPADFITVCNDLECNGKLDHVGGPGYITGLINCVPTSGNAENYAQIIEKKWAYRQLAGAGSEIVQAAYDEQDNALEQAEGLIYQIRHGSGTSKAVANHVDVLGRYMDSLLDLHDQNSKGVLAGMPTGFSRLNKLTGGLRKKKYYVLAGRPGDGKTAAALCIADAVVRSGGNVLFFSLEMDEEELMQRWVAMEAMVDSTHLRDGTFSGEEDMEGRTEWDRVCLAEEKLRNLPGKLLIDDTPGNTDSAMRSKALHMQTEYGIDLIIVDYLQYVKVAQDGRKLENRRLEVEEVSRNMKNLARELEIPVLALAQLNRESEGRANKRPQLSDLREAGGIEQDCDAALFIHKDPNAKPEDTTYNVDLLIEKHRNGARGVVPLYYVGTYTKFYQRVEEGMS